MFAEYDTCMFAWGACIVCEGKSIVARYIDEFVESLIIRNATVDICMYMNMYIRVYIHVHVHTCILLPIWDNQSLVQEKANENLTGTMGDCCFKG